MPRRYRRVIGAGAALRLLGNRRDIAKLVRNTGQREYNDGVEEFTPVEAPCGCRLYYHGGIGRWVIIGYSREAIDAALKRS